MIVGGSCVYNDWTIWDRWCPYGRTSLPSPKHISTQRICILVSVSINIYKSISLPIGNNCYGKLTTDSVYFGNNWKICYGNIEK